MAIRFFLFKNKEKWKQEKMSKDNRQYTLSINHELRRGG